MGKNIQTSQLMKTMQKEIGEIARDDILKRVGKVQDPETGTRPEVKIKGHPPSAVTIEISGSENIKKEVKRQIRSLGK